MTARSRSAAPGPRVLLVAVLACAGSAVPAAAGAAEEQAGSADRRGSAAHGVRVRFDRRPVLEIGEAVRIELGGRIDADAVRTDGERRPGGSGLAWSGRRLEVAGRVTPRVSFEVSRELGVERRPWRDLFADVELGARTGVRGGRFKVPFSEERTRSAGRLDFVRRSHAARALAPGRDIGLMGHGRAVGRRLAYEIGIFRGDDESSGEEEDPITRGRGPRPAGAARLLLRPFAGAKAPPPAAGSLRVGASLLRGDNRPGFTRFGVRTTGSRTAILQPIYVNGPRTGVGLEAHWSPGPVRVAGEWIEVREARRGQALDGSDLPDLAGRGWYASALWRVVGPATGGARRFWLRSLELGARTESIAFGTGRAAATAFVNPRAEAIPWQRLRAQTVGATWAVNRWGRIQVNAVAEQPDGLPREWSSVVRFQLQM